MPLSDNKDRIGAKAHPDIPACPAPLYEKLPRTSRVCRSVNDDDRGDDKVGLLVCTREARS